MRADEGIHKKWKPNTDHRPTTMASNTLLHCVKSRAKGCQGIYEESIGMSGWNLIFNLRTGTINYSRDRAPV